MVSVLLSSVVQFNLPAYEPSSNIELVGAALTSEQHDHRYALLGENTYVLHLAIGEGELLLVGTKHLGDPEHVQFTQIKKLWDEFRPTVVFIEGRGRPRAQDWESAIVGGGESGAVSFLAKGTEVKMYTSELPREGEVAPIRELYGDKKTALFFVLRGYYGQRRNGALTDAAITRYMTRRLFQYGLKGTFTGLADLDAFWKEKFNELGEWRTAEEKIMWPRKGGTELNEMAILSNKIRDEHFLKSWIDASAKGERVFVTVGRSHVISQEPVLMGSSKARELPLTTKRPWKNQ